MSEAPQSPDERNLFQSFRRLDSFRPDYRLRVAGSLLLHLALILAVFTIEFIRIMLPPDPDEDILTMVRLPPLRVPAAIRSIKTRQREKGMPLPLPTADASSQTAQKRPEPLKSEKAKPPATNRQQDAVLADLENVQEFLDPKLEPSHIAEVIRFYLGILGRRPEPGGWTTWTDVLIESNCAGASCDKVLLDISEYFVSSEEFRLRFGGVRSNQEFADLIYHNALGRSPSASEAKKWLEALDTEHTTRGQMARAVVTSPECVEHYKFDVMVILAYIAVLHRMPEENEFNGWRRNLASGNLDFPTLLQTLSNLAVRSG
ncbi:MAG TPA: DUF4214 domain-containing protein [Acidobacteriota bacterium]